ncbi:(3R)-3-methyl-D-ornithyl-N6-L-lysine dehydrogenase pyrrolysine biosynthesis enzyme PylD [Methanonatronarchaeum thermophilum]|uniref:(3R)-3-methyl-D-ornithyl-N6-L-lysine dehydrogenase pyrrolysine biosynthesis enzyme PylD n=1 Tax=Methanonatronarchaeum thermophilum TaxID=1927129 RepID=A0A1Y3GC41_9EURY|nr:hypothetical protein [Methanonatronarchaeum thermophilum]OUJ18810.1 (3R)-3-methyl-D-ornithyl-N6-L-lysine dehydrogenase pyrrolysine biosynthesis enzyme PylD [Methanonatronarchaeum thermophilum]
MTRLDERLVCSVVENLNDIDRDLRRFTGLSFREVCRGGGFFDNVLVESEKSVSVVPLSCGDGEIPFFSDAVCEVLRYVGFDASVVERDVFGISRSFEGDFDGVLMADDQAFVGIDLVSRNVSDNDSSTSRAYSILTRLLVEKFSCSSCLLVGLGDIGGGMLDYLFGSELALDGFVDSFFVHDIDVGKVDRCLGAYPVERYIDGVGEVDVVIDATPSVSNVCYSDVFVDGDSYFVLPGVPVGPYPEGRGFFDPLALGACSLAYMAFSGD